MDAACPVILAGLIPARAGNTGVVRCLPGLLRAHPRSRGEHRQRALVRGWPWGSSPLARGTPGITTHAALARGLIPARAGNTHAGIPYRSGSEAHPRSRGEHPLVLSFRLFAVGSSPLARGTLGVLARIGCRHGLIPARAGNTQCPVHQLGRQRAHPRSRGEHFEPFPLLLDYEGSSPLARGTRVVEGTAKVLDGLIPARAGNTPSRTYTSAPSRAHPRSRGEHSSTC